MKIRINQLKNSKQFHALLVLWSMTALSCLFIFVRFLFGSQLVVFKDAGSDTIQQYIMQYAAIVNQRLNGSPSFWNFYNGFGTSIFALNLFNPFLMLVYAAGALLGVGHIPGVLVFVIILEIFLAGTFCYFFLNCFPFSEAGKTIASYLYGLSGYLLVWGQHYQFGAFVVFLPLLLLFLERGIQKKKLSMAVPIVASVMVCSSVYMSYMSFILTGCYLIFRLVITEDLNKKQRLRQFVRHCVSLIWGICIGMAVLLPTAYYLLTISSRLDTDTSLLQRFLGYCTPYSADFYKTACLRFCSTTFQGIRDYNGYSNFYEAPVLFFSALFVLLAFQYLFTIHRQRVSKKKKTLQYLAAAFFFFCMFFRAGASIFNAFAYPFSRHAFLFLPLFALLTAFTLDQLWLRRQISYPALVLSLLFLALCHAAAFQEVREAALHTHVVCMAVLALVIAAVLFAGYWTRGKKARRIAAVFLFGAVASSMCLEGYLCYNERDTLTTKDASYWGSLYNPNVTAALDYLRDTDSSFYRVEKDYACGSYCMDAPAQGYYGVSTYNSTPNRNLETFIQRVTPNLPLMAEHEYTYRQIGNYTGHGTLFGIKYLLSQNPDLQLKDFTLLKQFGDVYIYQNQNVASLARFYAKSGDVRTLQNAYGKLDLEKMLLETALFPLDEDGKIVSLTLPFSFETPQSQETLAQAYALEKIPVKTPKQKADGSSDSIRIPLDRAALDDYTRVYMEFDIQTPEVSDVTVCPDQPFAYHFRTQKKQKKHVQIAIPASWSEVVLSRYGGHFKGTIRHITFYGAKTDAVCDTGADITFDRPKSDSQLSGHVSTEQNGFLFFPIPYENGWRATLNDVPIELLQTDEGFISIPCPDGSHDFTLTYIPPYFIKGLIISLMALLIWIVTFYEEYISPLYRKEEPSTVPSCCVLH